MIFSFLLTVASVTHATTYIFTTIDIPGATYISAVDRSQPYGINNSREIVGSYVDATGTGHGFHIDAGGNFTTIDVPAYFPKPLCCAVSTFATGINDSGDIVGYYFDATGWNGFLRDVEGNFITFDSPFEPFAYGINNSGDIVGTYYGGSKMTPHGFVRSAGGNVTTIDVPDTVRGYTNLTYAYGINNYDNTVGSFHDTWGGEDYAWGPLMSGTKTNELLGSNFSYAYGINSCGSIVGYYLDANSKYLSPRGFLRDAGGNFTLLDVPGAYYTYATGINDNGEIVGGYADATGMSAFIATPQVSQRCLIVNFSVTPTSINFGSVSVGQSANQIITINNQPNSVGALIGSVGMLTSPFSVVSGGGAFNLMPGQSMTVTARFSPTTETSVSAHLSITHNSTNQNSPTIVSLSGTGTPPPETVSAPMIPNGPVSGITGTAYAYSTGGSTSNLGTPVEYQFDWKGDGSDRSNWGSGAQSKTWTTAGIYNVRARARSATDVSIMSGWSNPLTVSISVPKMSVTPTTYDFGNLKVKRSKTASLVVTNSGTVNLSILTSTITGTDASMFKIMSGGGNKTIKPGKSLAIRVTFKPTSIGLKTSALHITSNDPVTPTIDTPLSGTGQ